MNKSSDFLETIKMAFFEYQEKHYVSVPVETNDNDSETILCVDISGSMAGSPLKSVNEGLQYIKENSNGKTGTVYVRSEGKNQKC